MTSACATSASTASTSRTLALVNRKRGLLNRWRMLPYRPVDRSSSAVTLSPRLISLSTRCEPMKPAPPVTRARTSDSAHFQRLAFEERVVDLLQLSHHAVGTIPLQHHSAPGDAHRLAADGVGYQRSYRASQSLGVATRYQEAVHAFRDDIGHPPHRRSDHGTACGARLDHRNGRAFIARAANHDVEVPVHIGEIATPACK